MQEKQPNGGIYFPKGMAYDGQRDYFAKDEGQI